MKKLVSVGLSIGLFFSLASYLLAGGIENVHNYSAEWVRTLNRQAATDSADAVVYNPAGVMRMDNGTYVNFSSQYTLKDYEHTYGGVGHKSDTPTYIPSLFAVLKKEKWAGYAAFHVPAGGGKAVYENGSLTTQGIGDSLSAGLNLLFPPAGYRTYFHHMEAQSTHYGYQIGGAYALSDAISFSLGLRHIKAEKESKGLVIARASVAGFPDQTRRIEYEQDAEGWGAIMGVNLSPVKDMNIGLMYETRTNLEFETHVQRADLPVVTDGAKARRDLPALLGLGVSYNITPRLRTEAGYVRYFNDDANWNGFENKVNDGYDIGICLEYAFTPKLKGSLGYMYTETGINPDDMTPEKPELDAQTVGAGFRYGPLFHGLDVDFGVLRSFYSDETTSTGTKLSKEVYIFSLGLQYKF